MTYPVNRDLWGTVVAHGVLSVVLLYAPLLAAARLAAPGEPLFGGSLAVLAPVYYLGALFMIAAPSVQSIQSSPQPAPPGQEATTEDGPIDDLKRRYVEDEVSEREFEERLERLLEE